MSMGGAGSGRGCWMGGVQEEECLIPALLYTGASLVPQLAKNPPAMREMWVRSLGWDDPPEEGMATHSSILAWILNAHVWPRRFTSVCALVSSFVNGSPDTCSKSDGNQLLNGPLQTMEQLMEVTEIREDGNWIYLGLSQ